jgi:GT2 family glycosyltransferase
VRIRHVISFEKFEILCIRHRYQHVLASHPEGFLKNGLDGRHMLDHFKQKDGIECLVRKRKSRVDGDYRESRRMRAPDIVQVHVGSHASSLCGPIGSERQTVRAVAATEIQHRLPRVLLSETHERSVMLAGLGGKPRLIDIITRAQHMGPAIINARIVMSMKNQSELLRALRKELAAKEKELADQKWVFEQFLQSPTWRMTAPIRWIANRFRAIGNGAGPASTETTPPLTDEIPETHVEEGPSHQELKATFASLSRVTLEGFLNSGAILDLPHSEKPRISIVLVLFNRAELTLSCLRSICENHAEHIEVVIVDNASSDQTPQLLERLKGAHIIRNTENRHFLLGVNQAARECRGDYILLLNNDSQLLPGALQNALTAMKSAANIGGVGGKIILLDGTLQEAGSVVWQDGSCTGYGRGDNPFAPMYNFRRDVDYCSGAFLLTPRKVWEELGGFDEAFKPAYYEETDYCMRLWQRGLRVVYEPTAALIHYEFASSESVASATSLQAQHQSIFEKRHRAVLERRGKPAADRLLAARSRETGKRVLFLEDRVPHLWLGSGFPRSHALVRALLANDCQVTLYPLAGMTESWDVIYSDLPKEVEVMSGWGREMLESFLRTRRDFYTTIIVTRPHNMEIVAPLVESHPEWFERVDVIYDGEALFASREAGLRKLAGNPLTEEEVRGLYAAEVGLTRAADRVLAVSEGERAVFLDHGVREVEILGHSLPITPTPCDFENRAGLLFVGAVHEEASPNGDSLIWFLTEIYPRIRAALGDIPVTIAGVNRSERLQQMAKPPIRITGHLTSLTDLYASARLFIAPTRYAAGIPHKIHEAAAHGLPVVSTPLLATQLGWTSRELGIAETAEDFAARCIEIYKSAERWQNLRDAALERVRRECSPEAFTEQVRKIVS